MHLLQCPASQDYSILTRSSPVTLFSAATCKTICRDKHDGVLFVCAAHGKPSRGVAAQKPINTHNEGIWRFFNVEVPADKDLGKDDLSVSPPVLEAIALSLNCSVESLPCSAFRVVRKSFDARKVVNKISKDPRFMYTVDLDIEKIQGGSLKASKVCQFLKNRPGKLQYILREKGISDVTTLVRECKFIPALSRAEKAKKAQGDDLNANVMQCMQAKVTVVGSGPAGLFAALVLAESGAKVVLLERGEPVESRGRDIGQLMVRRVLKPESNFCYGEGGAGTWSDGKLTTQIGRNSDSVKSVLASLVKFGAPSTIMIEGKPHIGTDRLVHILRGMRRHLQMLGVQILFTTKMVDLIVRDNRAVGVTIKIANSSDCEAIMSDAVVLAVGHSSRDLYHKLLESGVHLSLKDFAVGFRIEHPQELINEIQYKKWASRVQRGSGKIPVADYKVATSVIESLNANATQQEQSSCYSFCMCPGGQIVPTSTNPEELCINGMSFSRRSSKWANAGLVMPVSSHDLIPFINECGPLAGVAFQKSLERKASIMGGGDLVVPVQTVSDFLDNRLSGVLPSSSYRLGVKEAPLHSLFSDRLTRILKQALVNFDKQMPGFINKQALLHAVETRTSSPVKIVRDMETFECVSLHGLYPIGEGAGYAGGIISAAVDGLNAGLALAEQMGLCKGVVQDKYQIADKLAYY